MHVNPIYERLRKTYFHYITIQLSPNDVYNMQSARIYGHVAQNVCLFVSIHINIYSLGIFVFVFHLYLGINSMKTDNTMARWMVVVHLGVHITYVCIYSTMHETLLYIWRVLKTETKKDILKINNWEKCKYLYVYDSIVIVLQVIFV